MVTICQDMLLPPGPILGGREERRIWGLAAGDGFASLKAPKGEGAEPGSCRIGETGLCHPWCLDEMLGKPNLCFSSQSEGCACPRWLCHCPGTAETAESTERPGLHSF